jgi:hypothetical protein
MERDESGCCYDAARHFHKTAFLDLKEVAQLMLLNRIGGLTVLNDCSGHHH